MTTYKTTTIPIISSALEQEQQNIQSVRYSLKWRQRQLLVNVEQLTKQPYLPPLTSEQLLVDCLRCSPVKLIQVDAAVGEICLKFWAEASEKARKAMFLRLPPSMKIHKRQCSFSQKLKRLLDSSIAAILLLVLCPVIIGLFCLLRMQSLEPILLRQWHVSDNGKLFRLLKFRTTPFINNQSLGNELMSAPKSLPKLQENTQFIIFYWMRKLRLDKLPQLINVLRGEMSLNEPGPLSLEQAVRLSLEERKRINALLEIKGT